MAFGSANFASFLQDATDNEEVDIRDKAVEQRRRVTERYHAAIERGRHPRSFGRVNDLWRHIKQAESRRSSVKRGQKLRKVSSLPISLTPVKANDEDGRVVTRRRQLAQRSDDEYSDLSEQDGDPAYIMGIPNVKTIEDKPRSRSGSYADSTGRGIARRSSSLSWQKMKQEKRSAPRSKPSSREEMYQIRPLTGDEAGVNAQLEKQRKIEESHGSVERRTHKLGRRMSMFRVKDAAIKSLPRMVGRREMQGDVAGASGGNRKADKSESGSLPEGYQKKRRNRREKRYTQRLVGLDGMSDTEYDPTPDMVQKKPEKRKTYFGAAKIARDGMKHAKKVQQGLTPTAALKEVQQEKKMLNLGVGVSSLSVANNEKQNSRNGENNNGSKMSEAPQKVHLRAKKEVLPEFTSILNATVFYGSVVALQMSDGKYLTVIEDTGEIKAHSWPGIEKYGIRQKATNPGPDAQNGRMLFTLYDMRNPGNQEPIKYGDPVWFVVCTGNGIPSWKKGSCIAAKIMSAPQLATIGLESSSKIRNPENETINVGSPIPLPCVVQTTSGKASNELWLPGPITKDNPSGWYSKKDLIYEKLYKERNAAAMSLGKWFMLPVQLTHQESIRRSKASYAARTVIEGLLEGSTKSNLDSEMGYENRELINGTEIYLERDWFYISGNPSKQNRNKIIIRQLPGTNEDSALSPDNKMKLKKMVSKKKAGDNADKSLEVDRRGVFKIRLISGGQRSKGQNKEQQKIEATFHMARQQLKKSRSFRDGNVVEYEDGNIKGGEKFSMQLRLIHQDVDLKNDNKYLLYEDDKLTRLENYFEDLYENSPVRILDESFKPKKGRARRRSTSSFSTSSLRHIHSSASSNRQRVFATQNDQMLKLLHQSVSGPHINLWDPDRIVSARLKKEARDEQQTREEQSRQDNRLSRLMKYASLPDDELPSRSVSRDGSRPTSKASSRPVSRSVPRIKEKTKDVISDDAVARLLGIDKHTRPMTDVLGDEDSYMKNTIFASQQVEYRARTADRRTKEAKRRKRNEEDRKARMLQAEVDRAEVAAKLHEIGQRRAQEAAEARAEAERQRLS